MLEETFEQQQIKLLDAEELEKRKATFTRRLAKFEDFLYDRKQQFYWDIVYGECYEADGVDCAISEDDWPTKQLPGKEGSKRTVRLLPSKLIKNVKMGQMVDGSTWWPGGATLLENWVPTSSGLKYKLGALTYNTYCGPELHPAAIEESPEPWIKHVKELFPNPLEHEHFFNYAAHMLQFPETKVNHGIVVSGAQGIGKDTMLLPLRHGVGLWNVAEVGPDDIEESFNPHIQSVMLVINEVRPYNESHRASGFYNRIKPLLAAPPDSLPLHMKHMHKIYIKNVMRVFLTTNDYLTMFVPEEDRRLFIIHSSKAQNWAKQPYFEEMFRYLANGGKEAVVNWLLARDISEFKPGATPPMTEGKQQIIGATQIVRRNIINDAFDDMVGEGEPPLVFFNENLKTSYQVFDDEKILEAALRHSSLIHKMQELGYDIVKKEGNKPWRWKHTAGELHEDFKTQNAYVKKNITGVDRIKLIETAGKALAASRLARKSGRPVEVF